MLLPIHTLDNTRPPNIPVDGDFYLIITFVLITPFIFLWPDAWFYPNCPFIFLDLLDSFLFGPNSNGRFCPHYLFPFCFLSLFSNYSKVC